MNFRSRMASLQYSRRSDQQHGGDHSARGAGPRPTITGSGLSIAIIRHAPADRRLLAIIPFVFILKRHAAPRRQPVGALRVATKQAALVEQAAGAGCAPGACRAIELSPNYPTTRLRMSRNGQGSYSTWRRTRQPAARLTVFETLSRTSELRLRAYCCAVWLRRTSRQAWCSRRSAASDRA